MTSIWAAACLTAWNAAIGLPNCLRCLAYSTVMSSMRSAAPSASAATRTAARSARCRHAASVPSTSRPACRRVVEDHIGDICASDPAAGVAGCDTLPSRGPPATATWPSASCTGTTNRRQRRGGQYTRYLARESPSRTCAPTGRSAGIRSHRTATAVNSPCFQCRPRQFVRQGGIGHRRVQPAARRCCSAAQFARGERQFQQAAALSAAGLVESHPGPAVLGQRSRRRCGDRRRQTRTGPAPSRPGRRASRAATRRRGSLRRTVPSAFVSPPGLSRPVSSTAKQVNGILGQTINHEEAYGGRGCDPRSRSRSAARRCPQGV